MVPICLPAVAAIVMAVPPQLPPVEAWLVEEPWPLLGFERTIERLSYEKFTPKDFRTGSPLFDGEWIFGTHLMAGYGTAQQILADGEADPVRLARLNRCIETLMTPRVRGFTKVSWGSDPLDSLESDEIHHAAYLGYFNLLLGLTRSVDPGTQYADLHDRITAALIRRMKIHPLLIVQTYPREAYPVDMCAVIASVALHQSSAGEDHQAIIDKWLHICRSRYIENKTGLLCQAVRYDSGQPNDYPRGSGTALGAYFLSFVDVDLSKQLYGAIKTNLLTPPGPMQGVKEYVDPANNHRMDIDSGPIIAGLGTSATGFTIGLAKIHGDEATLKGIMGLSYILGNPEINAEGDFRYVVGYPLSSAIMYAMLTSAPAPETVARD